MKQLCWAIASATMVFLGASSASAQETCLLYQRGTVECPGYGAPAATAVPGPSMDGSTSMQTGTSTTLFKGAVPPNAFMVQVLATQNNVPLGCFINDSGPAGYLSGFAISVVSGIANFSSPPGYKPIGPVSIYCASPSAVNTQVYVAARGW
jgi:hypothetical protein